MYRGYRIVATTCFGRRRYTDLLTHYTSRSPLIDQHQLWINTENKDDLKAADRYCTARPEFFIQVKHSAPYTLGSRRYSVFYESLEPAPDTIYIRLDDDIVWIEKDAIKELLDVRIGNPDYFLIYANIINNSLCSHLHQRSGILPLRPFIEYECMGNIAWRRWKTASEVHSALIDAISQGEQRRFRFQNWVLLRYERCSINALAWWGSDNPTIQALMSDDEEKSLSCDIPEKLSRYNMIAGGALVSHFAYSPQRAGLERNRNLLEDYRRLCHSIK